MPLPPFTLERWFARYEFNVQHLLCSSDSQSMRVRDLLALEPGAAEQLQDVWLGYTESLGDPALRAAIAELYPGLDADHVLVHAGAEEAIFNFVHGVLTPGDHVVAHVPAYQSLYAVAEGLGCEVTPWTAREEDGWALDPDLLPSLIRSNTRAVVINSPHNPTGWLMDASSLRKIAAACDERGAVLFSDEVYRQSEYDAARELPAACTLSASAVSLGVMSKSYGLAGLRIGWIATRNRDVFERMARAKDYTTICSSAPSEFLASVALRHRETILARNVERLRSHLALADRFFVEHAERLRWVRPQAGPIAFPSLVDGTDAEPMCDRLVRERGVLLLPGGVYGTPWRHHFRLGLGRDDFPQALALFDEFLKS